MLEYRWYAYNPSIQLLYKNKRSFINQVWDIVSQICSKRKLPYSLWESSSLFTWIFIYLFCFVNAICRLICNINYFSTSIFFSPLDWQQLEGYLYYSSLACSPMVVGGSVAKSCLTSTAPWTVACQAPLSMGFPKLEYWSGLPFPSPCSPMILIKFSIFMHIGIKV